MSGSVYLHLIYGIKTDDLPGSPHPDDLGLEHHETEVYGQEEYHTEFAGVELCEILEGMSDDYTETSIDFSEWERLRKEFDAELKEKGITGSTPSPSAPRTPPHATSCRTHRRTSRPTILCH